MRFIKRLLLGWLVRELPPLPPMPFKPTLMFDESIESKGYGEEHMQAYATAYAARIVASATDKTSPNKKEVS